MSKNKKKTVKAHGDLPYWENVAPRDYRGKERQKDPDREKPLAPDGISGYW